MAGPNAQSEAYHSMTITRLDSNIKNDKKNTWRDWHLVPTSRPTFSMPSVKTSYIDIPGSNSVLDLTTALTGYLKYGNRQGSFEFLVIGEDRAGASYGEWYERYSEIATWLHGHLCQIVLDDDQMFYYEGRMSVSEWKSDPHWSLITFNYNVKPFKMSINKYASNWFWDTLAFGTKIPIETSSDVNVWLPYYRDYDKDNGTGSWLGDYRYLVIGKGETSTRAFDIYTYAEESPRIYYAKRTSPDGEYHGDWQMTLTTCGTNLLKNTNTSKTLSGVTFTINTDGTVSLSGTATGLINYQINTDIRLPGTTTYYLSGCPANNQGITLQDMNGSVVNQGTAVEFTTLNENNLRIHIPSGANCNGMKISPMIRTKDSKTTTYEQYEETTYELSRNWQTLNGLYLSEGHNVLTFTGNGYVTIELTGGRL